MPYSYQTTIIETPTDIVTVPFPYILKDHVSVQVDDEIVDPITYTWVDGSNIQLADELAVDASVKVFRTTPADEMFVYFTSGTLEHKDLNDGYTQLLFIVQEALDAAALAIEIANSILDYLSQIIALYNQMLALYDQMLALYDQMIAIKTDIDTIYSNIQDIETTIINLLNNLDLYYDIAITIPYTVYDGDVVGSWCAPAASHINVADIASWRVWTLSDTHASAEYRIYLLDGSYNVSTHVATATIPLNTNAGSFAAVIASDLDLAAGAKFVMIAQDVPYEVEDVHFHINMRRGALA